MTATAPDIAGVDLRRALADAVRLVNDHAGETAIKLLFETEDLPELDFIANAASFQGDTFTFTSGIESYDGSLKELRGIRAEVIRH